jgi:predicted O-methyltransferase YrrM
MPLSPNDATVAALLIDGYMDPVDLRWLADMAAGGLVIEIGCWKGKSTKALTTAKQVYTIDNFIGPTGFTGDPKEAIKEFYRNLSGELSSRQVTLLPMDSDSAAPRLKELKIKADMVFIDGKHTYEQVKRDIENYLPLLKPGGLICGHDIDYKSVKDAVDILEDWHKTMGSLWWKRIT